MNETTHITARHRDYTGSKIGMWLFLVTELCLFFGPVLLFAMNDIKYPTEFHAASGALDRTLGTLNTVILLTSSLTAALSVASVRRGNNSLAVFLLMMTIALGGVFLFNKYFEWGEKIAHGIYPGSPGLAKLSAGEAVFYGLYFFTTGLHALHVLAGMALLSVMSVLTAAGKVDKNDFIKLENSALYWHLVDIVWIYLFPLFYLIS
ncbi:MAG: cytochrome c oxidase subunit 3 [Deltaproteobacteria bacterium]|nr:cytochrome c oxidase subunit 3 [Deltaproteobacteria bacterium]